jgi:hypothetical protein
VRLLAHIRPRFIPAILGTTLAKQISPRPSLTLSPALFLLLLRRQVPAVEEVVVVQGAGVEKVVGAVGNLFIEWRSAALGTCPRVAISRDFLICSKGRLPLVQLPSTILSIRRFACPACNAHNEKPFA